MKIEGAEPKDAAAKPADNAKAAQHEHSDFNADYVLECTSIDKLTSIEFPYFRVFPAAEELEVNLVTQKGQSKFEVKRSKPRLSLAGKI